MVCKCTAVTAVAVGKKFIELMSSHVSCAQTLYLNNRFCDCACACNRKVGIKESALNSTDFNFLISFQTHLFSHVVGTKDTFLRSISTVESRSIVSTSIVFPHVLFAIFCPELSSI